MSLVMSKGKVERIGFCYGCRKHRVSEYGCRKQFFQGRPMVKFFQG